MKNVLYFGHLGKIDNQKSYGDAIGYWLLKDYIDKHYRKSIRLHYLDVKAGQKLDISNKYDFYLLGCGTCLSNLGRYYADQLLMSLSKTNKPYGVLGAGVYFEDSRPQKKTQLKRSEQNNNKTIQYVKKAKFIAVRDDQSKKYFTDLCTTDNVFVCNDPGAVVSYPKINIKHKKPILGFNLAGSTNTCLGAINTTQAHHDIILKYIQTKKNYLPMYFPFNNKDVRIGQRLKNEYGINYVDFKSPQYIAGTMQNCDAFIGIRVHADITCTAYGIPYLSIAYTEPNVNFLNHISYNNYIKVNELNSQNIKKVFEHVENNSESIKDYLIDKTNIMKNDYYTLLKKFCDDIMRL